MNMGFGEYSFMGSFGMIVFWGLVIALVIWAVRGNLPNSERHSSNEPVDILKKRYAAGEIDKEEFESKRRDLEK